MNFLFDNCTSPVLASTIDGFVRHLEQRAFHIRDSAGADLAIPLHAKDVEWIGALGADPREWIVVTGDRRIATVAAEKEAFRRAGLKGFLLAPAYQKMKVHQQASALLWRWPEVVDLIAKFRAPTLIEVPQTRGGSFAPCNGSRRDWRHMGGAKDVSARLQVAVIGAGMYGVSAAEWLRRAGHDVLLIDREGPAAGTSFGNAGIVSTSSVVPVPTPGLLRKVPGMLLGADGPLFLRWSYLPRLLPWLLPYLRNGRPERVAKIAAALADLLGDAVEQHLSLARGTPAERWLRTGDFVYLYRDRAAYEADGLAWELRHRHGVRGAQLEGAELANFDPNLGPAYRFAYCAHNHAWLTDPGRYVQDLAAWFEGQGGRFLRAEVSDLRPTGKQVQVIAGAETLLVDRAVIACGAWSARLAEALGHRAMLESERGYHIAYQGGAPVPPAPYSLADAKLVVTPMDGAVRAAGLVEFGGLAAGPSAAPHAQLERRLKRLYPGFAWTGRTLWQGHRPTTADSLPHIGPAPGAPQIFFGFGGQHVGMASGAKAGRLLADMISGARPNIDMAPFRPGRFDRPGAASG